MIKQLTISIICVSLMACATTTNPNLVSSGKSPENAFPMKREASNKRTFLFSPKDMAWAAYDKQGFRVKTGPAGGGSAVCPEDGSDCRTVIGEFTVQRKGGADCESSKYPLGTGGAPMAYCMHFHKGYAIHGAPGEPKGHYSHGCIRVKKEDARWLNKDFLNIGSNVVVGPY
tara:strand:- start:219 stop:734 length:516 start_codon:yes stop_codon:yes gene_type:complete